MHCTDEELLLHVDGELSALTERRVKNHLKSCWRCRTRLSQYEEQIHRLTTRMDEWPFPPPEWSKEAKQRLERRLQDFEVGFSESPSPRFPQWAVRGALAAALILCLGGGFLWMRQSRQLRPAEVIAQTTVLERTLYEQPVHQKFSVKIAQIRPVAKAVSTELEIWCDRGSGKFASRLSENGGAIKHALWRPSVDEEFVYRPAVSRSVIRRSPHRETPVRLVSLADNGLEVEQLEAGFMQWLESRSWTPISFASDISTWSAEDGTIVRAERVHDEQGSPLFRITAERKSRRMVAVLTVEVESHNYWPRLQKLRFETPEQAVDFSLQTTSIRPVRPAEIASVVYPPDLTPATGTTAAIPRRDEVPAFPAQPAPDDIDNEPASAEIEAHYALHKAGACLGQAVRVSQDSDGTWIWKLAGESGAQVEGFTTPVAIEHVLGALADLREAPPVGIQLPAEDSRPLAVALRHAWAMERLALRFPRERSSSMSAGSRRLLALMLREHAEAARKAYSELGMPAAARAERLPAPPDWQQSASDLFASLARLQELLQVQPASDDLARLGRTIDSRMQSIVAALSREARQGAAQRGESRRP
ncbi:MAG TPA: zf-HC2 domain-containing protein [Bryobacteraceae bacterium]|nr:zf-HC2 domain-containing protein [Bryobacteraceae bacterium]HPU71440.1 zf-HC2 domain-containing protein [Bryobacteraceae bacterium]